MADSVTIYGIANCDTIKKTKQWLTDHEITFQFHDYRKQGLDPALLRHWVDELGWEALINKRGTTWRQLSDLSKTVSIKNQPLQSCSTTLPLLKDLCWLKAMNVTSVLVKLTITTFLGRIDNKWNRKL
jgi:Spx/MgsR family transcriptional regulator